MSRIAKIAAVLFAMVLAPIGADAADQQVSGNSYRTGSPRQPFYGRSDGWYWTATTKIPVLIGNGDGYQSFGPTYTESFAYGDAIGVVCERGQVNYTVKTGETNGTCSTVCAAEAPEMDCVFGYNNGGGTGIIAACSSATAEECVCFGPDEAVSACGTTFEADDGAVSLLRFGRGVVLAYHAIIGQEIAPDMDASSLDIGGDQTDDDGLELAGGIFGASGRPMIVGDDPAFKFCVTIAIEDADGTDDLRIGWRTADNFQAAFDNYLNAATIGYGADEGTTAAIEIETIDDNAATTTTDTTQSNSTSATDLCVLVSDAGAVTYTVDGAAPTVTAAFTFDDGDAVIPFVYMLQQTQLTGEVDLTLWEVTYQ